MHGVCSNNELDFDQFEDLKEERDNPANIDKCKDHFEAGPSPKNISRLWTKINSTALNLDVKPEDSKRNMVNSSYDFSQLGEDINENLDEFMRNKT